MTDTPTTPPVPLPTHITHGATRFAVCGVTDPRNNSDEKLWGRILWNDKEIAINEKCDQQMQASTLLHELTHLLIWKSSEPFTGEKVETICNIVGLGLVDLFAQSPQLVEYLASATARCREGIAVAPTFRVQAPENTGEFPVDAGEISVG